MTAAAKEVSAVCKRAYEQHPDKTEGLHAYRYEVNKDGSCTAYWANDPTGKVKTKKFDSLEEASLWSPRDEV
jgi:hypothetical protein